MIYFICKERGEEYKELTQTALQLKEPIMELRMKLLNVLFYADHSASQTNY